MPLLKGTQMLLEMSITKWEDLQQLMTLQATMVSARHR